MLNNNQSNVLPSINNFNFHTILNGITHSRTLSTTSSSMTMDSNYASNSIMAIHNSSMNSHLIIEPDYIPCQQVYSVEFINNFIESTISLAIQEHGKFIADLQSAVFQDNFFNTLIKRFNIDEVQYISNQLISTDNKKDYFLALLCNKIQYRINTVYDNLLENIYSTVSQ